jgi:hypothetical protein
VAGERFCSCAEADTRTCVTQAVAWCAVPFPQYSFPDEDNDGDESSVWLRLTRTVATFDSKTPGHGAARVQVNFWFFLFVYYGFYNLSALIWITKVFNLYRLNWYVVAVLIEYQCSFSLTDETLLGGRALSDSQSQSPS